MAKTAKYTIEFHSIETPLSTEIQISGKEFDKQLRFLRQQIDATAGNEFPVETYTTESDFAGCTVTRYRFSVATGDVYLAKYQCKPGYQFKATK